MHDNIHYVLVLLIASLLCVPATGGSSGGAAVSTCSKSAVAQAEQEVLADAVEPVIDWEDVGIDLALPPVVHNIPQPFLNNFYTPFIDVAHTAVMGVGEGFTIRVEQRGIETSFNGNPVVRVVSPSGVFVIDSHLRNTADNATEPIPAELLNSGNFPRAVADNGTAVGASGNAGEGEGGFGTLAALARTAEGEALRYNPPDLPDGVHTMLFDVSADAGVVVGMMYDEGENRMEPAVSEDGDPLVRLPLPPNATGGIARVVSPDGRVIAGEVFMPRLGDPLRIWHNAISGQHPGVPCVWVDRKYHLIDTTRFPEPESADDGGEFGGDPFAGIDRRVGRVLTVNNRAVIAGYLGDRHHPRSAFIWDPVNGLRVLSEIAAEHDLDTQGFMFIEVLDISGDGQVVFGNGMSGAEPAGFVMGLPR